MRFFGPLFERPFLRAFFDKKTHIFKDFFNKNVFCAKSQPRRWLGFFAAFFACRASRWWWCNVAWKRAQKWPKIIENRRFFGVLSATPSWEGSPFIIFRLFFASWLSKIGFGIFVLGLFNLKRQFFGSQLGLNFGQKMALMLWPEPRFCGSDWLYVAKAGFLGPPKIA